MTDYPDVLGYITKGARLTLNGVQVALAISPRVVRAGGPFHALVLAQNTTDAPAELSVTLSVPGRDIRRPTGYFAAPKEPTSVRLRPGEVGYLLMPVVCHPDTPAGDQHKVGAALTVKPTPKARPLRPETGGSPVDPTRLNHKRRAALEKLREFEFSITKRRLREELEASFKVIQGLRQQNENSSKGGWFSLWNMAEDASPNMLLTFYGEALKRHVLPKIKKSAMFEPLCKATEQRFQEAGYPLKPLEAAYIAKLLTLIVHMADPGDDTFDHLRSQEFNVATLLNADTLPDDVHLPRWFEGLVRGVAFNEQQVLPNIPGFISTRLYDALIRDAAPFAFQSIQTITGEDLGSEEEIRDYTDRLVKLLHDPTGMDFAHTYLPLVMGGAIVFDRVVLPGEKLEDTLRGMSEVLAMRDAEWSDENDLVFLMMKELVNRSLRLFGFQI
jgi:hypothetical protein